MKVAQSFTDFLEDGVEAQEGLGERARPRAHRHAPSRGD